MARVLPPVLIAIALVRIGIELFVTRPEATRFASGRRLVGRVVSEGRYGGRTTPVRRAPIIAVEDPELGWQEVESYSHLRVGEEAPVRCVTALRRCASAEDVAGTLARWPFTSGMIVSTALLVGAVVLRLVARPS